MLSRVSLNGSCTYMQDVGCTPHAWHANSPIFHAGSSSFLHIRFFARQRSRCTIAARNLPDVVVYAQSAPINLFYLHSTYAFIHLRISCSCIANQLVAATGNSVQL